MTSAHRTKSTIMSKSYKFSTNRTPLISSLSTVVSAFNECSQPCNLCYTRHSSFSSFSQCKCHKSQISCTSGAVAKFHGHKFGNFTVNKSHDWDIFKPVMIDRALLEPVTSRCFPASQQTHIRAHTHTGIYTTNKEETLTGRQLSVL